MRRKETKTSSLEDLRRRAELSDGGATVASLREPLDAARLAHELSVHEIEESLRAEEARTKEVEAQLLEIAQHLEDALMLRKPDGRFSYVSPGYERIWGRPAADLLRDRGAWEKSVH